MLHYFIGNLGHFFVITSFVTSLVAAFAYARAASQSEIHQGPWILNGRTAFIIHSISVLGVIACLFVIIQQHYFEYHYAYSHSSLHLPGQYMISCFWEGQEGSFLLWMFWHAVIGLVIISRHRAWEAPVMSVFALVQGFLASMILGVVIPGLEMKIGSSPFILLRDALSDPIFTLQPDFIPKDGNGLNPLLQNYWMVIHPPTLFLGFALTLVPFSFVMAGLWMKKYTEWIKPALPWTLLGGSILGLGILMGGYWAYETLSFGGYWNWDPVENAVYVPWLILIASLHTMLICRTNPGALKLSIILVLSVFLLILYSTFLTRSGVLGDASVHAFTDLGLNGQLLIYLFFFTIGATVLAAVRWKHLPKSTDKELSSYSREFWIFLGVATLCLMGFQVLVPTSIPVYNKVVELFGVQSNYAPPANAVLFYSRVQLWFGVGVALLSGTAQFFWWTQMDRSKLKQEILTPVLISLILFALVIALTGLTQPTFMALALAGIYIIVSNGRFLYHGLKTNPRISGGPIAHVGVGLVLIGILYSAGYSRVVSLNNTGLLYNRDMGTEFNRDNLLLFVNEPRTMGGYEIEFLGERLEPRHKSGYVRRSDVEPTADPFSVVALRPIMFKGELLYNAKDTFEIYPENTFYEIQLSQQGKVVATLFPRVQINPSMGMLVSPDIRRNVDRDLYTHVSAPMNREAEPEWSAMEELHVQPKTSFFLNDYVAEIEEAERVMELPGHLLSDEDVAVKITIRVQAEHDTTYLEPMFLIRDKVEVGRLPAESGELGVKVTLLNIHPDKNEFVLGVQTRQKDWVIIKAMEKPYINILWLGTGLLTLGFMVSMVRRFSDASRGITPS